MKVVIASGDVQMIRYQMGMIFTVSGIAGGSVGGGVTGTYGTINNSKLMVVIHIMQINAADALDAGDTATDVFTYTVSDGNGGTDTATITITSLGVE